MTDPIESWKRFKAENPDLPRAATVEGDWLTTELLRDRATAAGAKTAPDGDEG